MHHAFRPGQLLWAGPHIATTATSRCNCKPRPCATKPKAINEQVQCTQKSSCLHYLSFFCNRHHVPVRAIVSFSNQTKPLNILHNALCFARALPNCSRFMHISILSIYNRCVRAIRLKKGRWHCRWIYSAFNWHPPATIISLYTNWWRDRWPTVNINKLMINLNKHF